MNLDVRSLMLKNDLKQWRVAEAIGYSEYHFSRIMRVELPQDFKKALVDVIEKLGSGQQPDLTVINAIRSNRKTKNAAKRKVNEDSYADRYADRVLAELEYRRIKGEWGL